MTDIVSGFSGFEKKMKRLKDPKKIKSLAKKSINFALTPVVKDARSNAPVGKGPHATYKGRIVSPGFLSRNIKKASARKLGPGVLGVGLVGFSKEAWYGKLYESGFTHKGGKVFQPLHFMRDAYQKNKKVMVSRFRDKASKELKKMVN